MRTLDAGRRQTNIITTRKREHSRKPDELYSVIEACSPGPYLELFARHPRKGWVQWGNEEVEDLSKYPIVNRAVYQQMVIFDKARRSYGE
jgi:N6-adenosine-specific RNA methylase IME4